MSENQIIIRNLKIFAYHGVHDFEKQNGQNFVINIIININKLPGFSTDNIQDTISYSDVIKVINKTVTDNKYNLIEKLAESISDQIFLNFKSVVSIEITVKKPDIKKNLDYAAVKIKRYNNINKQKKRAVLALGSNLGDRVNYLNSAIESIKRLPDTEILKVSKFHETEPLISNTNNQDINKYNKYINCCVEIQTSYSPEMLMGMCLGIESAHNRTREYKWSPRTLDIDILTYENEVRNNEYLTLPHPHMHERDFVQVPLKEIKENSI